MAFKIGIAGSPNTGKSYSRRTIPDGENVIILSSSYKAPHLKDSKGKPIKPFDLKTEKYPNLEAAKNALGSPSIHHLIGFWNQKLAPGKIKADMLMGNMQMVNTLENLPIWMKFISDHMPWIHTVIIPDFTHFISRVISTPEFINRKAGGEAYQRFWELAATALRNFILSIDDYRHDLAVVTEYHAEYDETLPGFDVFVPAGKMMKEKFLIPSYYDVLLFTDIQVENEGELNESAEYRFVTKPTKRYPYARALNLWDSTYIPNDLNEVLTVVREYLGVPWESKQTA